MLTVRNRDRYRKARAILCWGVVAFICLQLCLGFALEQGSTAIYDPDYFRHESRLRDLVAENPEKPLFVMLGSSRVANGFEARITQELWNDEVVVFNFGIPTTGPFLQQVWFDRLLAAGIVPDTLFLEIMPPFLHERQPPLDQSMLDASRLRFSEIAELPFGFETLTGPLRKYSFGKILPTTQYGSGLQDFLQLKASAGDSGFDSLSMDRHGWLPVPRSRGTPRPDLVALAHRQYDACYDHFRPSKEQTERIERLIQAAQSRGIRVGLILMPEGSEFRGKYSPEMSRALYELLRHWESKFGVVVVDARDWLGDEWFYDMHHLVQMGATAFSNQFQRTIRSQYPGLLGHR